MTNPFDVRGLRVLVTGSSRGIGRAIAQHLSQAGAEVAIHGRDESQLEVTRQGMASVDVPMLRGDLREPDVVARTVTGAVEALSGLDAVINNVGGLFAAPATELSLNGFAAVVASNLHTTFLMSTQAFAHLRRGGGSVVNISSAASVHPIPNLAHYGAAKAGVNQLTRTLAAEWAGTGVRSNAIVVGVVATELSLKVNYGNNPVRIRDASATIGVGRLGRSEDVAWACHFLISPGSSFVNGALLALDGGPAGNAVG